MNLRIILGVTLAAIAPIVATPNFAQTPIPIQDLQQVSPGVTVTGRVVSVVGNEFILDDGTGEVIVDAGPRWWQEINVSEGEELTVTGEVGRAGELDAFTITRSDGSTINIRPPQGPPPWAGGPNRQVR